MKSTNDLTHQQACDLIHEIQLLVQENYANRPDGSDLAIEWDLAAFDNICIVLHKAELV